MRSPLVVQMGHWILTASFLVSCRTAHNVAVTSFRVIDAPANYIRRHIDNDETSDIATHSDVTNPGGPVVSVTPPPRHRREVSRAETEGSQEARSSSVPSAPSAELEKIPSAKPVPGKPGYVYSPFDPNGGYVDVTGYASGSKAKDPYSGKIFIVP
jgi:hypothetical protein